MKRRICKAKGFTLVEIIVVIAIIGVLAAILVPTMVNVVTSSEVASSNSTAAGIQKQVDIFMTNADTAGYGMFVTPSNIEKLIITVSQGDWTVTAVGSGNFDAGAGITWNSGTGNLSSTKVGVTDACELLAINLAHSLRDVYNASIVVSLRGGKCMAVAYCDEFATGLIEGTHYPTLVNGDFPSTFTWNHSMAGVSGDGYIIGTCPAIPLA